MYIYYIALMTIPSCKSILIIIIPFSSSALLCQIINIIWSSAHFTQHNGQELDHSIECYYWIIHPSIHPSILIGSPGGWLPNINGQEFDHSTEHTTLLVGPSSRNPTHPDSIYAGTLLLAIISHPSIYSSIHPFSHPYIHPWVMW